jgi:signal transduction histidine kinase
MQNFRKIKWLPFISFAFLGIIAIGLWENQNHHDRELVLKHLETSAEQVCLRVEGMINARLASLELMADRWVERQPPDFRQQRFQNFAATLSRNYPGFDGIFWIDPLNVIQWVFPKNEQMQAVGKKLDSCIYYGNEGCFDSLKRQGDIFVTSSVRSPEGNSHFYAIQPLVYKGNLKGYLAGFFSVDQIMTLCLTKEILNDFYIKVSEETQMIYEHGNPFLQNATQSEHTPRQPIVSKQIRYGGKTWKILFMPDQSTSKGRRHQNLVHLGFGLALAAAISVLLHFLIKRIEMYKVSRDRAVAEVNQRKKAQAALNTNEKKLQALLSELTAKNAELESFVYTVSHDLKTPIVTIEGFVGALREDFGDKISSDGEQYLRYMSDATHKMELLINELLNYSRIGRLEGKKTTFTMNSAVKEAIATLQPQIEARRITVVVQTNLPMIYGNRKRIEQAIYNIVSNAVKYIGQNNADPRIEIGCTKQNNETIFWVKDNGVGIDQKYFEKIFRIFERLPAAKQATEGTGIGLAIVRRIIEHHSGDIWLESEPGKGSTFYFTLKEKETD